MTRTFDRLLLSLGLAVIFGACASSSAARPSRPAARANAEQHEMHGVASYYARSLEGNLTANGEVYDHGARTCAHKTLPFGTWLEITVLDTGKTSRCRVNDRGPFVKGRILDVSGLVADELGLKKRGVASVRLRRVSGPDAPVDAAPDA